MRRRNSKSRLIVHKVQIRDQKSSVQYKCILCGLQKVTKEKITNIVMQNISGGIKSSIFKKCRSKLHEIWDNTEDYTVDENNDFVVHKVKLNGCAVSMERDTAAGRAIIERILDHHLYIKNN